MWLGKALFLKGDGRRDQAVQEYREGVRVLQESKADQRSPSMALFRWYLGKALLETGEVKRCWKARDEHGNRGLGRVVVSGGQGCAGANLSSQIWPATGQSARPLGTDRGAS